jgi:hypothetical protein
MARSVYPVRLADGLVERARRQIGLPAGTPPSVVIRYAVTLAAGGDPEELADALDSGTGRRYYAEAS